MAAHSIKRVQQIPVSLEKAWEFFSDPANLKAITPPGMGFKIVSPDHGKKMYAGQIIEYRIKPFMGIPVYWMTEITQVKEKDYFIDEQKLGPYQLWHHEHHFKEIAGGVEMSDLIYYKNPMWLLGKLANSLFVRKKLLSVFEYRFRKVEELFGKWPVS